ncbi:MAG: arginine decarboxylase, pyruvoyl-dependent [Candidatus Methylarchaceae archaeon HK02M1]|nr:arginine decarboxylase, pyruvoyl-dependent [Candidatus Methylarchaceae archaeon HK01M]MCP8312059.1 arginine decarboxylase, pyruvoyl-dependent [Candidatus Methylarchaceae archaeon HK02M1]
MIPTKIFLTKGLGIHKEKLASFELALRDAGIAHCNLVYTSSIFPPNAKLISKNAGFKLLSPGQIVHVVMSKIETNEPNRLIAAAIGVAIPQNKKHHGYLSEHHAFGQTREKAGEYAEDLAAFMLASTMGVESFDIDKSYDEKQELWRILNKTVRTRNICQSVRGNKDGLWTYCIAAAVMI